MSDGQFGLIVAFVFVLLGGIMVLIPQRMLDVARRYNDDKFWARNATYEWMMKPSVYMPWVRALGSVAMLIGLALTVLLWLTRSQRV
jgi:hypothetical protein